MMEMVGCSRLAGSREGGRGWWDSEVRGRGVVMRGRGKGEMRRRGADMREEGC